MEAPLPVQRECAPFGRGQQRGARGLAVYLKDGLVLPFRRGDRASGGDGGQQSGDKTQEVLWRIARIDWQTVAPKRIMLMIGTNNTGHGAGEKPENTFNGIKAIVRQLRASCPEAKITLLKIFPRGANGQDPKRKLNDAINARLPELADEEHVFLRDVGPYYLMPDGDTLNKALLPDLLHPTKEGHRLWAAAISRDFLNDYE